MAVICLVLACVVAVTDGIADRGVVRADRPADRPLAGATGIEISKNLETFAEGVVGGEANLAIVGDSINVFSQPDWMYTGYLLDWQPRRWRQIQTSPLSNSTATASWVEFATPPNYPIIRPGQSVPGFEAFAGANTWPLRAIEVEAEDWSGRAISSGVNRNGFSYQSGMFRDADGQGRFLRSGNLERHRTMIVAADQPDFRTEWTIRSRNSAAGTGWTATEVAHEFDCPADPGLVWFDHVIPGSTDGLGNVGTGLFTSGVGPLTSGIRTALPGTIITDLELDSGFGLSYIGEGGWRTENHLLPFGDPESPLVPTSTGAYPGGYTNEALIRHILAHEVTHFMLWVGTNNGGTDTNVPWTTAADVTGILDRYRLVHAEARKLDPDLPEPAFLLIAPYSSNDADVFFSGYADELRSIAGGDVAFIDLHAMVLERFGDWSTWEEDLLSDGVHPNLLGARTFARMLWRELIAAAGSPADLNRDGLVNGADFGLLLGRWGCDDPGYADLDGNGCVLGSDLGIIPGDWSP